MPMFLDSPQWSRAAIPVHSSGERCGLAAVGHVELGEDVADMQRGRLLADEESAGDRTVGCTLHQQVQNVLLAWGEAVQWAGLLVRGIREWDTVPAGLGHR